MFLDDIAARLVSQGVGTKGTNIFLGSKSIIPEGAGPYLTLTETGGAGPMRVQNYTTAHVQRPTAQILVRAKSYLDARTMIANAYAALDGIFNTTINGVFYQRIVARQEPTDLGLDSNERPMLVFNIECEKARS